MMPRYRVQVSFTQTKEKEITVYAKDEDEAAEKACAIVEAWDGVDEADAMSVDED